jgi:hypothetical protein
MQILQYMSLMRHFTLSLFVVFSFLSLLTLLSLLFHFLIQYNKIKPVRRRGGRRGFRHPSFGIS